MGWLNSFKKKDSAVLELSKLIFVSSISLVEQLKSYLEEKFGKDSKDYHQKYIEVLFEFVYFYLQLNDRIGFQELGYEKRQKLNDVVGPLVVDSMIKTVFANWSSHLQEGIKKDFYENLNNAQIEYSKCKALMLREEEDISYADKVATGAKSRGSINLLADNLMKILNNHNPITRAKFMYLAMNPLRIKELKSLVLKASKEI